MNGITSFQQFKNLIFTISNITDLRKYYFSIAIRSEKGWQEMKILFLRTYPCYCSKTCDKYVMWGINQIVMKFWGDLQMNEGLVSVIADQS